MTPKDDWAGVNVALGRVCTLVPELTVMDAYNSVSSITDSGVLAYFKSVVSGADAERAYDAGGTTTLATNTGRTQWNSWTIQSLKF